MAYSIPYMHKHETNENLIMTFKMRLLTAHPTNISINYITSYLSKLHSRTKEEEKKTVNSKHIVYTKYILFLRLIQFPFSINQNPAEKSHADRFPKVLCMWDCIITPTAYCANLSKISRFSVK